MITHYTNTVIFGTCLLVTGYRTSTVRYRSNTKLKDKFSTTVVV